ncbi:MAG: hypothetical protein M3441_02375 [Chloroflexota bacterium]|nr:hypothetical protein [Chloroflexota bacterium]
MAENDPKNNDGLSPEEIDQQEISDLPNREAMSLITPDPTPVYYFDEPVLDRHLDPTYKTDPVDLPTA